MDNETRTIHITKALSSSMIVELIDEYPNLEEITCSPSVYNRTSRKYIEALATLDIKINKKYKWGAKSRSNNLELYILKLSDEGLSAREISNRLEIPLNRVYYLLRKGKASFNNRQRKHDHDDVKRLKSEGLKPKEISEKLDIPLRTVYYILNKK